jgi:hypothetical protein
VEDTGNLNTSSSSWCVVSLLLGSLCRYFAAGGAALRSLSILTKLTTLKVLRCYYLVGYTLIWRIMMSAPTGRLCLPSASARGGMGGLESKLEANFKLKQLEPACKHGKCWCQQHFDTL